jgi:cell division protein FtsI (penicillin-binding protein 3)
MSVMRQDVQRRRLRFLTALLVLFAAALCLRLVQWQIVDHQKLRGMAAEIHSKRTEIPARRGQVLDRNGKVLATTVREDTVVGDPQGFKGLKPSRKDAIVKAVSPLLQMPADVISQTLAAGQGHYAKLKSSVPVTVTNALSQQDVYPAIAVIPEVRRVWPNKALLSQTLGFVNSRGEGIGIESRYNPALAGTPGEKLYDESYGAGLAKIPTVRQAQDGSDVVLTIDLNIQYIAERALENAMAAEKAITGCVVVSNPRTGEILAMAGRPTFDPNDYDGVSEALWSNPVISDSWEPGSIFKILTMAAALDSGKVKPTQTFSDPGKIKYERAIITNRDEKANGTITMAQILQTSSNVGTVKAVDMLSTTAFYTYMTTAFGLGAKTDIDLPFENEGNFRIPGHPDWTKTDLAIQSFGQSLATTPIQMVQAVGAVANEGRVMRPYVVQEVKGHPDAVQGPTTVRRAIKPETAKLLTDMLVSVVDVAVKQAQVPGYRLAGKTGTGLIPPPYGTYDPNQTIASFIGYGPADDPQFLILVKIDRPQVHQTGAEVAAPVFKTIAQWLLNYYRIPPSDLRAQR